MYHTIAKHLTYAPSPTRTLQYLFRQVRKFSARLLPKGSSQSEQLAGGVASRPIAMSVLSDSSSSVTGDSEGESSAGFEDPIWRMDACCEWVHQLRPRFRGRGRRLRLLLPFAGFDAPGQALDAMQISYSVAGAWDICPAAAKTLRARYKGDTKTSI